MKTQIAVTVKPVMGPDPSLNIEALSQHLLDGYTVNSMCAGMNDCILVILDAPLPAQDTLPPAA